MYKILSLLLLLYFCIFHQNNGICLRLSFAQIKWNSHVWRPNPPLVKVCALDCNSFRHTHTHSLTTPSILYKYYLSWLNCIISLSSPTSLRRFKVISTFTYCTHFHVILWWWFNVAIFETNGYQLLGVFRASVWKNGQTQANTRRVQEVKIVLGSRKSTNYGFVAAGSRSKIQKKINERKFGTHA